MTFETQLQREEKRKVDVLLKHPSLIKIRILSAVLQGCRFLHSVNKNNQQDLIT